MGNGAMAKGPKLPRPSSTLPERTLGRKRCCSAAVETGTLVAPKKSNRPLSDCRPPIRPRGEPAQTEFMLANDLVDLPVADLALRHRLRDKYEGFRLI
jgi:hypothetical protein